jgi:FixJ family two-component response regulator
LSLPDRNVRPIVVVIDDDEEVRETLGDLLQSVGIQAELFGSIQDFLAGSHLDRPGCLVLDVRLPGRSGLEFQEDLVKANVHLPVVFISGHADVPMSVRAMKAGAIEFLTKPVRHQELLDAIQTAIGRDLDRREREENVASIRAGFESLTQRERQVMALVVGGMPNKQIAAELGIGMTTVKLHRGRVMQKMEASSLAQLVRMADHLGVSRPKV